MWADRGFEDPSGFMVNDSKFATASLPVDRKKDQKGLLIHWDCDFSAILWGFLYGNHQNFYIK